MAAANLKLDWARKMIYNYTIFFESGGLVMAIIKPFRALRPLHSLVSKVAALPYDVVSLDEAKSISSKNDYSFLHVEIGRAHV